MRAELRWVCAGVALAGALACARDPLRALPRGTTTGGGGTFGGSGATGTGGDGATGGTSGAGDFLVFHQHPNRKLDLLFMVDDSVGMSRPQANLVANFPRFMDVLKSLPEGLPDIHIAVVSSSMGIGHDDIASCTAHPSSAGVFRNRVGNGAQGCTRTGLFPGATFVASTGGQDPHNNFDGDITAVLQCILPLGTLGCAFEQPLAAIARALGADGAPAPPENQGFLRPEAYLGIVLVTNEDDCSAADLSFYDLASNDDLASPLGPLRSFRCAEFGHLCDGAPPRRLAPNGKVTDTVSYDACVPAEERGKLTPVSRLAEGIRALKSDPSQILVTSIVGPATPYAIHWGEPAVSGDGPWPESSPSCTGTDGTSATPAIRMRAFTEEFAGEGLVYTICEANLGPAFSAIATKLSNLVGPACVRGQLADKDRNLGNGFQPNCTVIDRVPSGATGSTDSPIPACSDDGNRPPCWRVREPGPMETCPANASVIQVDRDVATPDDALLLVRCATCTPGVVDLPAGCL